MANSLQKVIDTAIRRKTPIVGAILLLVFGAVMYDQTFNLTELSDSMVLGPTGSFDPGTAITGSVVVSASQPITEIEVRMGTTTLYKQFLKVADDVHEYSATYYIGILPAGRYTLTGILKFAEPEGAYLFSTITRQYSANFIVLSQADVEEMEERLTGGGDDADEEFGAVIGFELLMALPVLLLLHKTRQHKNKRDD